jgi:hypothetical protein
MPPRLRKSCCLRADNLSAIESWRSSLSDKDKASQNNPQVILRNWRHATRKTEQTPSGGRQQMQKRLAVFARAAPIFWPQLYVRRAHQAMLDSRSSDLLTLARAALESAIRHEADLLDLLPPDPATASSRPGRPRTGHAAESAHV